jgi:hypothetical protein
MLLSGDFRLAQAGTKAPKGNKSAILQSLTAGSNRFVGPTRRWEPVIFLRGCARPDPAAPTTTYRIELDDRVWAIYSSSGQVDIQPGEPAAAAASLSTDPKTLNALLGDPAALDASVSDGSVVAAGDLEALRQLLQAVTSPSPATG